MRITIDTDEDIIIVPDNYFEKLQKINETITTAGGTAYTPQTYIQRSFDIAINDTDNRLKRKSDVTRRRNG